MTGTNDQGKSNAKVEGPKDGTRASTSEPDSDTPCTDCGERLGYAMALRGMTIHKPKCPQPKPSEQAPNGDTS